MKAYTVRQRKETRMNIFDEARALYGTIKMCELTQGQIAERLGVSQSYIANKLRLLKFSTAMQEKIAESGICERNARTLLRVKDEKMQTHLLSQIVSKGLTVAQTEALVDTALEKEETRVPKHSDLDHGLAACLSLLRLYGTVTEHRVTEGEDGIVFTVHLGR